eukprot:Pgem_evm1s2842
MQLINEIKEEEMSNPIHFFKASYKIISGVKGLIDMYVDGLEEAIQKLNSLKTTKVVLTSIYAMDYIPNNIAAVSNLVKGLPKGVQKLPFVEKVLRWILKKVFDQFNNGLRSISRKNSAIFLDVDDEMRKILRHYERKGAQLEGCARNPYYGCYSWNGCDNKCDPTEVAVSETDVQGKYLFVDGTHPSGLVQGKLAKFIADEITSKGPKDIVVRKCPKEFDFDSNLVDPDA